MIIDYTIFLGKSIIIIEYQCDVKNNLDIITKLSFEGNELPPIGTEVLKTYKLVIKIVFCGTVITKAIATNKSLLTIRQHELEKVQWIGIRAV